MPPVTRAGANDGDPRRPPSPGARPSPPGHASPGAGDSIDAIAAEWVLRPDLDYSPASVITRLLRVRSFLDAALARVFDAYGLSHSDFAVVVTLRRREPPYRIAQSRLMAELGLTSGTISVRVDRMAKIGIVTRSPDPEDRRGAVVELTPRGVALFDEIVPVHLANEDRLLSSLEDDERDQLADLLRRLLVSFEATANGTSWPVLGLRTKPAHLARQQRRAAGLREVAGLLVVDVDPDSPAQRAGLASRDLLVSAAGRRLTSEVTFADAVARIGDRASLDLEILREDDHLRITVAIRGPNGPHTHSVKGG